jgi:TolB-like protein
MKAPQHTQLFDKIQIAQRYSFRSFTFAYGLLFVLLAATGGVAGEDEKSSVKGKMIILPFTIQTSTPQAHLRTGLTNILATRMTKRTGLVAIQRNSKRDELTTLLQQGDHQAIKKILKSMEGDYLLLGGLGQQEVGYEIAIHVFSRHNNAPASFSANINNLTRTLSAMDELSIDIAEKIFNIPRPEKQLGAIADNNDGMSGFQTSHPDRAYKQGLYNKEAIEHPELAENSTFRILSSRRSEIISTSILAMDAGDLDGDGTEEIVVLERGNLALYRFSADQLQRVAEQPIAAHLGLHTIYLADLDKNGLQEIYIGASNGTKPASQIIEWDGAKFHILYQNAPFYLRPGLDSAGKPILIGQSGSSKGVQGGTDSSFYRITRKHIGTIEKAEKLFVPIGFNLYDFIRADLDQDGNLEVIGITKNNKLVVMDHTGKRLWKSEGAYGASKKTLGTLISYTDGDRNPLNNPDPIYMHTRIIAQDQNGDGKPEIIIGSNRLAEVNLFKRLRFFRNSSLSVLSWDGTQMNTLWESPETGYTVDYQMVKTDLSGGGSLFAVESGADNTPLSFWRPEEFIIHCYEIAERKNSEKEK